MSAPPDYVELAEMLVEQAPRIAPVLAGFNACVDHVYRMDPNRIESLEAALTGRAGRDSPGQDSAGRDLAGRDPARPDSGRCNSARLAGMVLGRVRAGRGGEIYTPWPGGPDWAVELFGSPDARQLGGTGPQAAWTLAVLGAPTVVALADRGTHQLAVLHPDIGVCTPSGVVPAAAVPPQATPAKPPHVICEFTSGTRWSGGTVSRSTRIILRFAADGIERDELIAEYGGPVGAALLSGLNGLSADDVAGRAWLRAVAERWRSRGVPMLHHELAEFADPHALRAAAPALPVSSLGMSLSELRVLTGGDCSDPARAAARLADSLRLRRLCVHSDTWSLAVHRDDPVTERRSLATGNLLAAARAEAGHPVARPSPPPHAHYTDDLPASRDLGDGWRVDCVPAPYLPVPAATIGLGDSFTAGTLLGRLLDRVPINPREKVL